MSENLYKYVLALGDNSMILGHRLSELCGHGPSLETDIALTNISLDLFGEVRNLFQYAATLKGNGATEDDMAYGRKSREFYNCILVEQPNSNFAYVIVRQFLFDAFHKLHLQLLMASKDTTIAAIALKSLKEAKYHLRFSSDWMKRLGVGTEESHQKMQQAVDDLYPYAHELISESKLEKEMLTHEIGVDFKILEKQYHAEVDKVFLEAGLTKPTAPNRYAKGKEGYHSEYFDYILSEFQYMQRAYPGMQW